MPSRISNSYVAQALYANPDIYVPEDTNDGRVQGVYITVSEDGTVGTDLTVGNDLTVNHDLIVNGTIINNGDESITGTLTVNNLNVTEGASIGGDLTVTGALNSSGGITIDGTLTTNLDFSIVNDLTVGNRLDVDGDFHANSGEAVIGTLTVDDITVNNNITITHDATISGDLTVNGNQTLTGALTADDLIINTSFALNGSGTSENYISSGPNRVIRITNSNIADLATNGIQLIPPIAANKIPVISYMFFRYIPNGTPYVLASADQYITVGFGNFGTTTAITCNAYVGELLRLDGFIGFNGAPDTLIDSFKTLRNSSFIGTTPELVTELVPISNLNPSSSSVILFSDNTITGLGGELRVYIWYDSLDLDRTS